MSGDTAGRQPGGDFYVRFEERFRGPKNLILQRLQVYVPLIAPLKTLEDRPRALDLGCGRGEWLEVLRDISFDAHGVDVNPSMLSLSSHDAAARITGDMLEHLRGLPDASHLLVSGFHIAEHLAFDYLRAMIGEVLRVLKPGGLMILETPNPENIDVSTNTFYLDPTHRHPIPPPLLAFLADFCGFGRTNIIRLQQSYDLSGHVAPSLADVLRGPSRDYALLAQKDASEAVLAVTRHAFELQSGVSLDQVLEPYEERLRGQEEKSSKLVEEMNSVRRRVEELVAANEPTRAALVEEVHRKNDALALGEARLERLHQRIEDAYTSSQEAQTRLAQELSKKDEAIAARDALLEGLRRQIEATLTDHAEAKAVFAEELAQRDQAMASQRATVAKLEQHLLDARAALEASQEAREEDLAAKNAELSRSARSLEQENAELRMQHVRAVEALRAQLNSTILHRQDLLSSTSWRVTAPLRKLVTAYRVLREEPRSFLTLAGQNLRGRRNLEAVTPLPVSAFDPSSQQDSTGPSAALHGPGSSQYESLAVRDQLVAWIRTELARPS